MALVLGAIPVTILGAGSNLSVSSEASSLAIPSTSSIPSATSVYGGGSHGGRDVAKEKKNGFSTDQESVKSREAEIEDILKKLTLEEKAALCWGRAWMEAGEVKRLGIGQLKMADGPQGVTRFTEPSALPSGISLSCTWNPETAYAYGRFIAREMLGLRRHVILGPGVNLMRSPLCGRNFEYYGEDPVLSGVIASSYVNGVQSLDVSACIKHLTANNQENHRCLSSSNVDERTLRELYLLPFEIAVKNAHPGMIMSSYNRLNGIHAAENGWLQDDVLKKEWGFDGVMVSDWNAVVSAKGSVLGGLDLEMGSGHFAKDGALVKMVKDGTVSEAVLDEKVRRMLRLMSRAHALHPEAQPEGEIQTDKHKALARTFAAEGMVLLKNNGLLPLNPETLKKVLVVGPNADKEHRGGGGSGGVNSPYEITPLQGLKAVLGDKVHYVAGYTFEGASVLPATYLKTLDGKPGLYGEYFDNETLDGEPVVTGASPLVDCKWGGAMFGIPSDPKMPKNNLSARWTGAFVAPYDGKLKIGIASDDGARLYIDGKLVIDEWREGIRTVLREIDVEKDKSYDIRLEYYDRGGDAYVKLIWEDLMQRPEQAYKEAEDADVVIFVGGTHHGYDTEGGWGQSGGDIPDMELIGPQAEIINTLAGINKNTVVALVNGSALNVQPWIDKVAALVEMWYGGQEAGNALADILFGKVNPSGKLSCTFGKKLRDYAPHAQGNFPGTLGPLDKDPHVNYEEGLFIGYRWFDKKGIEPQFPFGYGLSYTTFTLDKPTLSSDTFVPGKPLTLTVKVSNTGKLAGAEVVQLYVGDSECSVSRPEKELKAFRKVFLKPGESKDVTLTLTDRDFSFWDVKSGSWIIEPGTFTLKVGTSSQELPYTLPVSVK